MGSLLVLEPIGGIAGDMFLAATIAVGVDPRALEDALATLRLPGWRLAVAPKTDCGIAGIHVDVVVEGEQPHARGLAEILALVDGSGLGPRVKAAARATFERLGRAEAKVHAVALEEVHFHEVGAVDAIVDVCGAAVALDLLGWPRVLAAPPELGRGLGRSAHGPLPIPPPAVVELLVGRPVRPGGPPGEAVTPTGAAILAELTEVGPLPAMVPARVGYGVGTRAWPDRPNVLRATLAEPAEEGALWLLETNLDDATGQMVARAIDAALEAGALDAWAAPITMKKGRPAVLLAALAEEGTRAAVTRVLFGETPTLGIRRRRIERDVLAREVRTVDTAHGRVRVKVALLEGVELGAQPEHDDCLALAREKGIPLREVIAAALVAHRTRR
jgi:uncharacterized protein (TIGR00299 family) protein